MKNSSNCAFGYEDEDDNEDIAYLNFRLIWPLGVISALSVGFFLLAFASMEWMEHRVFELFAVNKIAVNYGKTPWVCNDTIPYYKGMWPSFLRQVEMKVLTNIFLRVAVCVPMTIRIFVAWCARKSIMEHRLTQINKFVAFLNDLAGAIVVAEVLSLSFIVMVTIRFDYPTFYKYAFAVFIVSSSGYMLLRTILSLTSDENEVIERLGAAIRLVSTIIFLWTIPQVFHTHLTFVNKVGCHGYFSKPEAVTEYIAILSYLCFNLTHLIEMRDMRFICYPKTCSGECEPLRTKAITNVKCKAKSADMFVDQFKACPPVMVFVSYS
ncbi:hypothetical protein DdX_11047 [Ditylenchus destructor]|uniref:Uncharacterized protein n=1 Tax=Ditylenchus destructor TaxID=166010 RepID=A0AAD4MWM8_9BILA|nr:hypothetical protein DdX_11047 [Ditylenchus destructor]